MTFRNCTPCFPVADVPAAVAWFCEHLGFVVAVQQDTHAYIYRDAAAIRLIPAVPELDLTSPDAQMSCYIDVDDVDAVYSQHEEALSRLREGFIRPPFDRDYGQREFHAIYENILILVGMPTSSETRK